MADSLVISGTIELLGGGVPSANPLCPGAVFRLQPGADPGAPQPTTDFVASLLLDGERPFGRRASNRTITLPIWITAPNRQILAAAREVLQQTIDQDMFTITWTRDPGLGGTPLPMILDCYRAQPSKPTFATWLEVQTTGMQIEVVIPARPYGRSDVQTQIAFAAPVPASPPAPPAAVTIDNFLTIATTQCARSSQCVVGPWSAMWDPDDPVRVGDPGGQSTPFIYAATLPAPLNLSGLTTLQLQVGLGTRYFTNLDYHHRSSGVQIAGFLTDSAGSQLLLSRSNMLLPCTPNYAQPIFSRVTIPIPQGNPLFNYSSVIAYSLTITNRQYPVERLAWVTCYLDNLTAQPPSVTVSPATRGYVYRLTSVAGTARAELSLTFTQPPTAGSPTTITAAGAGSYTVPAGTAWLDVQGWGGGGAGASVNAAGQGGGGAGAEYTRNTQFPASPGQVIPYAVGSGGSAGASPVPGTATVFGPGPSSSTVLTANGGASAAFNSPAGQAGASGSGDPIEYPGGAGHTASGGLAGGGGSSAGPSAPGNAPVGTGSVTFASSSSFVCPQGVTQVYVECWAPGGSGGCGNGSFTYGAGAGAGEYRAGYVKVTPGLSYPFTIGTGGSAVTGSNANGNAGSGATSFTGDNRTISANPGQGGLGGQFSRTGGGSPGSGGSGDVGFSGGRGGNAYPYTGGGGSGAGPGSSGNAGGNPGGGIAPPQGGNGGDGSGTGGGNGHAGTVPSGGGGGCFSGSGNSSGAGANGQIRITYPAVSGAPTNAGGIAVSGGGAGGQGGATAGQAGSAGSAPGGGGGGANSSGTSVAGGAGAAGQLVVTPFGAQPVNALIVHKPPTGAIKTFQPLIPVGAGADAPDGSHQYPVPQPQVGVNAGFYGTYTLYLIAAGLAGASNSLHTIQVTVTQYEFAGGGSYTVPTTPVTVTPAQVTNGVITAGVLTLPIQALAADNTSASYSVSVTSSNTSDRFYDLLMFDTMGSTVVVNIPTGSGYPVFYIDPPDPNFALGQVLGSWGGRGQAVSVSGYPGNVISGPPMFVDPLDGDSILFAYVPDGVAPAIGGSYFPHYYYDRPS